MNIRLILILLITHGIVGIVGFGAGIYTLPILIAPPAPSVAEVQSQSVQALYTAEFTKDLQDSDALHWGEGTVSIGQQAITLMGSLAPGPDYKLYLSPTFIETETDFKRLKASMVQIGDVDTFENFVVAVPIDINPADYTSVIVWCESFEQFITSAQYR